MDTDRQKAALEGIQDLLASKTWKPSEDDLNFAIGYVASYVRQVTGTTTTEDERSFIKTALMVVCR
jgi:hypothetical protein